MRAWAPCLVLLVSPMAGCLGGDGGTEDAGDRAAPDGPAARAPTAVVALVDTGINPYHVDFRDASELGYTHPSAYLPGYPADTPAVWLTLDAPTLEDALKVDQIVWSGLKADTLYWFPGTKIVGAYSTGGDRIIFDTGHGTMTSSRAAGNAYSLCPECRIAMVQGFTGASVRWASEQPWIDVQSNSWSPIVSLQQADAAQEPGLAEAFESAAARHAVFASAGNGAGGKLGVLGHPSFLRSTSGPRGVVAVGGHDNGQVILWSGSVPDVVADACDNWAAAGGSLDRYGPREGGGTSSASPYAAGEAARLVLEARRLLGDDGSAGVRDAILARGAAPTGASGLLADGQLTLDELKALVMKTAIPRPAKTAHDGELCGPDAAPYNTFPVAWKDVPSTVPTYYFIGYGGISAESLGAALVVLAGQAPLPERPLEDEQHAAAESVRDLYNSLRG